MNPLIDYDNSKFKNSIKNPLITKRMILKLNVIKQ